MRNLFIVLSLLLWSAGASAKHRQAPQPVIGATVPDFSLRNVDGREISFSGFPEAKGFIVVFTCNHCPFAKLYTQRFNEMSSRYAALGIPLIAINPMDTLVYEEESFGQMQARAKDSAYVFPYLQDAAQSVARSFRATHTPMAFIIWKEAGGYVLRYAGAIDDNGAEPDKAHSFIEPAIQALLQGTAVKSGLTQSLGCAINYR